MRFMDLFKNFCVAIVLLQAFVLVAIVIIVTLEEHFKNSQDAQNQGHAGKCAFCTLTNDPCIYADKETCDGCPVAQSYYFTEEKEIDKV